MHLALSQSLVPIAKVPLAKARLITEPTVGVQGTKGMVAGRRERGRHLCKSSLI